MSWTEILSLLVSIIAVTISTVSLVRTRKVQALQLEMQQKQAKLAEAQHNVLTLAQQAARKADLRVELIRLGSSAHFLFSNRGPANALDVNFAFFNTGPRKAPVIGSQFNELFPVAEFLAGSQIKLAAVLTLSLPPVLEGEFSWKTVDGTRETRRQKIHL